MSPLLLLFLLKFSFSAESNFYGIDDSDVQFDKYQKNIGRVGFYSEYLGTVPRKLPQLKSENIIPIDRIPTYGSNLGHTQEEKQAILNESNLIIAKTTRGVAGGSYHIMDQDGNLYLDSNLVKYENGTTRRLYKHLGAVGMFRGDVSDSEPAIIKRMNIVPHGFGYSTTGLFAPAGELITVRISEKSLKSCGTLKFSIGPLLFNDKPNNIWIPREFCRMPIITNTFDLTQNLFPHKRCIGDRCETANSNDDYYQLVETVDETTKEVTTTRVANPNFLKNVDYTGADYIFYVGSFLGGPIYLRSTNLPQSYDLTVSGAVRYAHYIKGYTSKEEFEQNWQSTAPYIDVEVWQSGIIHSGPRVNAKVNDYEDLYLATLYWENVTAVSHRFPSGTDVRCTINMMYECFIAAGGAVAFPSQGSTNCPEYWLEYVLGYKKYLKDSTGDTWGPHHEYHHHFQSNWAFQGDGEVSNNAVTLVAYSFFTKTSQRRTENAEPDGDGWNRYTSASFAVQKAISGHDNDLVAHSLFIHCFGQYLFMNATQISNGRNNDKWYTALSEVSGLDLSYFFLKVYKTLTFSDNVIAQYNTSQFKKFVPIASRYQTGVGYMIKGKRNEIHTMRPFRIEYAKDKVLNFSALMFVPEDIEFTIKKFDQPEHGSFEKTAENIYVYHPDPNHVFSGKITLTIGLRNKEISDFPVDDVEMYLEFMQSYDVRDSFKNERILDKKIYVYNEGQLPMDPVAAFESNYAGAIESVDIPNNNSIQNCNSDIWYTTEEYLPNRISELRGKKLCTPGKHRFALRGRVYAALFTSIDEGKTYQLAGKVEHTNYDTGYDDDPNVYHDFDFTTDTWVYFKAVLIHYTPDPNEFRKPFIGVGYGKFDEQGNVNIKHLSNAYEQKYQPIPDPELVYENPFPRVWTERYQVFGTNKGKLVKYSYIPWTSGFAPGYFDIGNLFDDDDDNVIHSAQQFPISESNPFSVTVDMGSVIEASSMIIHGANEDKYQYQPQNFKLYVGDDVDDLHLIATVTGSTRVNKDVTVDFKTCKFRYYQLNVTSTHAPNKLYNYVSYRYITFANYISGTAVSMDDDRVTLYNTWKKESKLSTFGQLYVGDFNSKVVLKFKGTKVGIISYSSPDFGSFWVYLDGVKVKFIDLNTDFNQLCCVFKKNDLQDTEHQLTIRGFTKFNIDSFIVGDDLNSVNEIHEDVDHVWDGIEPTATPVPTPLIPPPTPLATQSPTPMPTQSATPLQTQTPTPMPLLPIDQSVLTNSTGLVNITCDKFEYTGWKDGGRGQICIESGEADHGSFTRNTNAVARVKFIGTKFHILAWRQANSGPAEIRVDGNLIGTPNFNSGNSSRYSDIAFTSPEFPYGEHTLEIKHVGELNTQSVVFGSIYVDPVPSLGSFKLSYDDFKATSGTWTESTSTTPPTFTCTDANCKGEFDFFGTRFWLTGVRGSDVGEFEIIIDGGEPILIQERQEAGIAQNNLPVILYQSDELKFTTHKVEIRRTNYKISLVNFIYTLYPYSEIPTQSPAPTQSPYPLLTPEESILVNQEGLVNITCDKLEYINGWTDGGRGGICVASGEADRGSFTRNTNAVARVKFIGTKFHILAWKQENSGPAEIIVDGAPMGTPDFNSGSQIRLAGIAYTSPDLPYGEHTLEIKHVGVLNTQSIVIGSIYVDPLPDVGGFKLSYEDFNIQNGVWKKSTETKPPTFTCEDENCAGNFVFFGTRFWLTGVRGSDVGEFEIIIDDGQPILIQERQEAKIAQNNLPVILYQSEELEFKSHKVEIRRTNYKISLANILYTIYPHTELPTPMPTQTPTPIPLLPPDQSIKTNPTGLVNITCDKFEYTGWKDGGRGQICIESGEADHGSFTRNTNAVARVKFIGTKFHILAWRQANSGPAEIRVDGNLIGTPNFNSGSNSRYSDIAFTSPDFPYGEHTLEIKHVGELNTQSVVFGSIYVDPVPSVGSFKLSYDDFKATSGTWTESTSTTPPTFTCTDANCKGEFDFFGTRFWLTGVRGSDVGEFEIVIDGGEPILIQERQEAGIAQNNLPVILYQSDELKFTTHKVEIRRTNYKISLVNLICTLYPYSEIPTQSPYPLLPPDESVLANQEGLLNITCDKLEYTNSWAEGNRGGICVASGEANHGSFTRNTNAVAKLKFIGTKFHILAWKQENSGPAEIIVDGAPMGTPNFNSGGSRYSGIAYTSPVFPYGEHTLEIKHVGEFNTQSVVIGSIYVDPLPDVGGFKLSYEDFKIQSGEWTKSTATTPPTFTCSEYSCIGKFEFYGTRFWLTGVRGNDAGEFEIIIDDGQPILIQERQDASIAQNNLPVVLYQSEELEFKQHTVTVQQTAYQVSLTNLLYTIYPHDVSEIPPPPPEDIIVENKDLTESRYDKVVDNKQQVSVTIKVSNFNTINYKEDGGAIHVVNAALDCKSVGFERCTSEKVGGAIYVSNDYNFENQQILLEGLTFDRCEAQYGGAVYIYSSSSTNPATVRNCIFTNNDAHLAKENSVDGKYGGSAIFMTARNGHLESNTFKQNKGEIVVKIYNHYNSPSSSTKKLRILNKNKEAFLISNCNFEISEASSCCLFYLLGNDASSFELRECSFSGRLSKNAHYINGESINKNGPKLVIKKCRFAFLDSNLNQVNDFMSVDLKDQYFDDSSEFKEKSSNKWKLIVAVAVPAVAVVTLLVVVVIIVMKRNNNNVVEECEMASQSYVISCGSETKSSTENELNLPLL